MPDDQSGILNSVSMPSAIASAPASATKSDPTRTTLSWHEFVAVPPKKGPKDRQKIVQGVSPGNRIHAKHKEPRRGDINSAASLRLLSKLRSKFQGLTPLAKDYRPFGTELRLGTSKNSDPSQLPFPLFYLSVINIERTCLWHSIQLIVVSIHVNVAHSSFFFLAWSCNFPVIRRNSTDQWR